jgi:hypothetical protein
MSFITGKHLSRRTLLRGAGVAVALPFLDAMHPAFAGPVKTVHRLAVVYVPNGIIMNQWTPAETGKDYTFTRILKPLEPFREDVTIITGLANEAAGADVHAGTTFDQVAAKTWASETRVASLQLGCEDARMVGNCDTGSSCAYTNSLSWKDPDSPLAVDVNPRSVFERLFGNVDPSLSPEVRARRALYRRNMLDLTRDSAKKLELDLGPADRRKMDEYLTSVHEVEQRMTAVERDTRPPSIDKPAGIPFAFTEYVKLMFDLQAIAFQSDLTRVSTMMIGREGSVRTYPEIDVPDPHHPLTHHRGHPDFIEKVTKINCLHAQLFAHFVEKLKSMPEGDGTVLDHSAILYGAALSDGNAHSNVNLPLVLAGQLGGAHRIGGKHIKLEQSTPVANLFVSMLDGAGIPVEHFGDSTGRLDLVG